VSLIQRIKRRTKFAKSRTWTREVLREMAWLDDREYGWMMRDKFYPYSAYDQLEKRAYFAARTLHQGK
jgi:hypothetical protein